MRNILSIFLLFISFLSYSQDKLLLGLFWNERPESIILTVRGGEYQLVLDSEKTLRFNVNDMYQLSVNPATNNVIVKNLSVTFGEFKEVKILEVNDTSSINIKSKLPKLPNRVYEDDFYVSVYEKTLKIINRVELSNYVAGVVQWESGNGNDPEFYKAQAIITRTYALKNINKYANKGFNLCDRVDSQVYKGRSKNKEILRAVKETKGLVLVDENMALITAVFHSNSGGETRNSEEVWTQKLPYLRAVVDTFSIGQPHYNWTTTVAFTDWINTFKNTFKIPVETGKMKKRITTYCPTKNQYYFLPEEKLKATTVRYAFKLRSTFFCMNKKGDQLILTGKGFGHGVGLSQEGAMKMALLGYTHEQILHFYYQNVHLVNIKTMDFLENVE